VPLDKDALKTALQTIASSPPATVPLCAAAWADAIGTYAAGLTPPSSTVAAAKAALQTALQTAFGTAAAAEAMETAFTAFGVTLGAGQAPAFAAAPPGDPVGFETLFGPPFPATHAAAAQRIADAIHDWMTSGTATPSGGGDDVDWA
jgi:hypothetical protein